MIRVACPDCLPPGLEPLSSFIRIHLVRYDTIQHTDQTIPHYGPDEWTFARGALSTMDRNLLGPIGPYILHGICKLITDSIPFNADTDDLLGETHVVHHIHSKIPHCESTSSLY